MDVSVFLVFCCLATNVIGAFLPPMGWSSWNSVQYNVNDSFVRDSAKLLAQHFLAAGYEYILIDDGWPKCDQYTHDDGCATPSPRDPTTGYITIDPIKFPFGFQNLTDYVHSLGLKIGIYTAVSKTTCGGYSASLGFEETDAKSFIGWGFDFVKHDTCNSDCGVHDYCIQNSTYKMGRYLRTFGDSVVYYVDDGNPSSGMRLWNPNVIHCTDSDVTKVAVTPSQLSYVWANEEPFFDSGTNSSLINVLKTWFDREDSWLSVMDNLHHQIGLEMYQRCGIFNNADMLTIGMGSLSFAQYTSEFALWSVLGGPLIFGATMDQLLSEQRIVDLVTNKEILAINQDDGCVEGSSLRMHSSYEVWGKPLNDGSVAIVMLNKSPTESVKVSLDAFGYEGDLYPMFHSVDSGQFHARDVVAKKDLGTFTDRITLDVGPMASRMVLLSSFTSL